MKTRVEDPYLKIRMSQNLKQLLINAASDSNRSVTSEAVLRLERSFANQTLNPKTDDPSLLLIRSINHLSREQRHAVGTILQVVISLLQVDETSPNSGDDLV